MARVDRIGRDQEPGDTPNLGNRPSGLWSRWSHLPRATTPQRRKADAPNQAPRPRHQRRKRKQDMGTMKHAFLEVRAVRAAERSVDAVFSSDSVDSYGERVEQSFRLERFRANP